MRTLLRTIFILVIFYGCKGNNNEFEITDVHFKENIYKPQYMNYDYGTPIYNKQDLEKYRLKRLGQKVRVTYLSELRFLILIRAKSLFLTIKVTTNILVME